MITLDKLGAMSFKKIFLTMTKNVAIILYVSLMFLKIHLSIPTISKPVVSESESISLLNKKELLI